MRIEEISFLTNFRHDVGLKYTPDEKSIHLLASPNNERSVELSASYATPHPAIHAKLVAYVKNIIDGVANFEKENDKANGDLNINIIRANRLVSYGCISSVFPRHERYADGFIF